MWTWLPSLEWVVTAAGISLSTKDMISIRGAGAAKLSRIAAGIIVQQGGIVRLRAASRARELFVFLALEVGVLKNIGRGAHQAETHPGIAGIAGGENVAGQHHNVMKIAVGLIVRNFIDTGFEHGAPGGVRRAALQASFMMGATARALVSAAKTHSPRTEWRCSPRGSCRAHMLYTPDKEHIVRVNDENSNIIH